MAKYRFAIGFAAGAALTAAGFALIRPADSPVVPTPVAVPVQVVNDQQRLPLPEQDVLPEGWHEREFNGDTYYIIPLS